MTVSLGAIALVGSGEYLPAMATLEQDLIDDAVRRGKPRHFMQLATAAGQEGERSLTYWRELGAAQGERIGVPTTFLPVFTREHANDPLLAARVAEAGLLYLSGGNPGHLGETLVGSLVGDAIMAHVRSGGALAGCSAGAMVLGTTVPTFRFGSRAPVAGFDLLPGIQVIPHFNRLFELAVKGAPDSTRHLLGIENLTALVRWSAATEWGVVGDGAVHLLRGGPRRQLVVGESLAT
ncbi:MAG: Type 1 glutamine amidotransferase-like domain-containing protein [Chloroflexi bacterium]|nr:Type 1 glutamine amidotransferase-like domain-containing protein [Chloroflexota bacterium]